ncbi:MAG: dimethylsulfoniopropionate demethylase, partial [Paracoccaceae bacterium]
MHTPGISITRRLRQTPFSKKVFKEGVSNFTVYNHMLLPTVFRSVEEDYHHLKNAVQVWDVACERQVEITGPDAKKLMEMLTPRDLRKLTIDKCLYAPLTNLSGGIINDPVIVKVEEDRYWISIADSDVLLWVSGIATGLSLNVRIFEPDVSILAIQGPLSNTLMQKVFGMDFDTVKLFSIVRVPFKDTSFIAARSGFSKQGGFEIYVENSTYAEGLWDVFFEAGKSL